MFLQAQSPPGVDSSRRACRHLSSISELHRFSRALRLGSMSLIGQVLNHQRQYNGTIPVEVFLYRKFARQGSVYLQLSVVSCSFAAFLAGYRVCCRLSSMSELHHRFFHEH